MAKKTPKSSETPAETTPAPVKRRAPAKKKATSQAAPAIDIATVGGNEPLANASDTRTNATSANTTDNTREPSHDEIAQAAYFRHLNRGGSGGGEFDDWLEAEKELRKSRR